MLVLAIESSCDETACSVVSSEKQILANEVYSQIKLHQQFGGVVPEIASRAHVKIIESLVENALKKANLTFQELDAIAATCGPGLIGGLLVGISFAKALSVCLNKPFVAVNHLEGHALSAMLTNNLNYPFLLLLVSGGHSQIIYVKDYGKYEILGDTLDDALGETFDKLAKLLNLPYPGGPEIEKLALKGDATAIKLPMPLLSKNQKEENGTNFSFSGLKTHMSVLISKSELTDEFKANLCASFQSLVLEFVFSRLKNSILKVEDKVQNLVIAGGVASNEFLREGLRKKLAEININLVLPPKFICTDNAAMIAFAAIEKLKNFPTTDDINFEAKARWPI